ncbi:MAG: HAD family hydrolase [bacterium]|nr:HAD family hydrolase [bacterium]
MNRPLLVLDLDETLVYSTKRALPCRHDFECCEYLVYKRPFVDRFIESMALHYDLAVWTSSSSDYADCIKTGIFAKVFLNFLWSRDKCTRRYDSELQGHYWVKNLKKVKRSGYDLERVLFVDNTPQKLESNFGNIVAVRDFEGSQSDNELVVLAKYLVKIVDTPNFRAIEKRGWREAI